MRAVAELKPLFTKKQLRQILGLFSYYRSYVPGFAAIAKPLTDLTGGRQPTILQWGATEQLAFETLRSKIAEAPVLYWSQGQVNHLCYTLMRALLQ